MIGGTSWKHLGKCRAQCPLWAAIGTGIRTGNSRNSKQGNIGSKNCAKIKTRLYPKIQVGGKTYLQQLRSFQSWPKPKPKCKFHIWLILEPALSWLWKSILHQSPYIKIWMFFNAWTAPGYRELEITLSLVQISLPTWYYHTIDDGRCCNFDSGCYCNIDARFYCEAPDWEIQPGFAGLLSTLVSLSLLLLLSYC